VLADVVVSGFDRVYAPSSFSCVKVMSASGTDTTATLFLIEM
jgi:hypothetical protein